MALLPQERHKQIMDKLRKERIVRVEKLVGRFNVSAETIRRDLEKLEEEGLLQRVYGGAVLAGVSKVEPLYTVRAALNQQHKAAIGRCANKLVEENDTMIVDLGTTTLEFCKTLVGHRNLLIITNSLQIASVAVEFPGIQVVTLGGCLRARELAVSGSMAIRCLEQFHVNKAILGAGGIDLEHGLTDFHLEEAQVRRVMIEKAEKVIVLADHSKFGVTALAHILPLEKIDVLVTDWETPASYLKKLREKNITTIVAPRENLDNSS